MATQGLTPLTGAFVMIDATPGGPTTLVASRGASLQSMFSLWVAGLDPQTLPEPDMCTYGQEDTDKGGQGFLYRFRWFSAVKIGGVTYGLGANLHSTGAMGSMWMTGVPKTQPTPELHPFKSPTNPKKVDFQILLRSLVRNGTFKRKLKK
jgi:hypothetical protein